MMKIIRPVLFVLLVLASPFTSASSDQVHYIDGLPVLIKSETAPLSTNDSFREGYNQLLQLTLLKNDKYTDISSINFTTPAHGSVEYDQVTNVITYTPDKDYYGNDTFNYQIINSQGQTGNQAQVKLELIQGIAPTPVITPFNSSGTQYVDYQDKQLITLTTSTTDTEIYYTIYDLVTREGTERIRYTQPFYLYNTTRLSYWAEGAGYDDSTVRIQDFLFCKPGNDILGCTRKAPPPSLNEFGWQPKNIFVGAQAKLVWDVAEVEYCKQVFADGSESGKYAPQGELTFTATKAEVINSRWYCARKVPPSDTVRFPADKNEYLTSALTVEAIPKPSNLVAQRTAEDADINLSWDSVPNAIRYEIRVKPTANTSWGLLKTGNITQTHYLYKNERYIDHDFAVRACTTALCDSATAWSDTLTVRITDNLTANADSFVRAGSNQTLDILANDTIAPQFTIKVVVTTPPQHGSVVANADNSINYSSDKMVADSFEYQVVEQNQGYQSNITKVEIKPEFNVSGEFHWQPKDVLVGQISTLNWDITGVQYCFDTNAPDKHYKPNSNDEKPVKSKANYTVQTMTSNWQCLGNDGTPYTFKPKLNIIKLPAPNNLRQQT